jgi:hypothetical protein
MTGSIIVSQINIINLVRFYSECDLKDKLDFFD